MADHPTNGRRRPPRGPAPNGRSPDEDYAADSTPRPRQHDATAPPHDLDAERALLGAWLNQPDRVALAVAELGLEADHFYSPAHERVFEAVTNLAARDAAVDAVTVAGALDDAGLLDAIGGPSALFELVTAAGTTSAARTYAERVILCHRRREVMAYARRVADLAQAGTGYLDELARLGELGSLNGHVGDLHSLEVVDLGPILRGELEPEVPFWLRRLDGQALLYPGRVHDLHAEPNVGKTWLALLALLEALNAGGSGIFIDYEDSARGIIGRLLALGADRALLMPEANRFRYVNPAGAMGPAERAALLAVVDELDADVVVLDGVATALARDGFDENSNADVTLWADLVVRPIARRGSAVLLLDHVVKNTTDGKRARGARGAGAKLGLIDGASYSATTAQSYSKHRSGSVRLTVAKDRPGEVGAIGELIAIVDVEPADNRVAITLTPPPPPGTPLRPSGYMERLSKRLEESEVPLTEAFLYQLVPAKAGKTVHRANALEVLLTEGYVERGPFGPGTVEAYRLVKPYREANDPKATKRPTAGDDRPPPLDEDYAPPGTLPAPPDDPAPVQAQLGYDPADPRPF